MLSHVQVNPYPPIVHKDVLHLKVPLEQMAVSAWEPDASARTETDLLRVFTLVKLNKRVL